ncbi:MAG: hypothetical protein ACXVB1_05170 [Pseudobdellovibrionaceae bacterium]
MKLHVDFFINPIVLVPVGLMFANDHWLKYIYPGWVTGKLSDFTGVFYFPIFIMAMICFALQISRKENSAQRILTKKNLWLAILFTDFLLVLVKLCGPAARWIEMIFATSLFKIQLVQDPTDLIAMSMNILTYLYMKNYLIDSEEPLRSSPGR